MSYITNPLEMGSEVTSTGIPSFLEGRFITLRIVPPKGKTIRDGLVTTNAMISYLGTDGIDVPTTSVTQSGDGLYHAEFPQGKRGIMATKYRGPKSWYTFRNDKTGKKYTIGKNDPVTKVNDHFTMSFVEDYLAKNTKDWDKISVDVQAREDLIDQYFEEMYMYGLAKDYNLAVETDKNEIPRVGMITNFYRKYTPPKEGERFGNVIVTKFAPQENKETLSGDYTMVDTEIAAAIYEALTSTEPSKPSFDPTDFVENSDESII